MIVKSLNSYMCKIICPQNVNYGAILVAKFISKKYLKATYDFISGKLFYIIEIKSDIKDRTKLLAVKESNKHFLGFKRNHNKFFIFAKRYLNRGYFTRTSLKYYCGNCTTKNKYSPAELMVWDC